jgi:hypothetical protein
MPRARVADAHWPQHDWRGKQLRLEKGDRPATDMSHGY